MGHDELKELLVDYLYGELPPEEVAGFEKALAAHPELRAEAEELKSLLFRLDELEGPEPPADVVADVLAAAQDACRPVEASSPSLVETVLYWLTRPQMGLGFAAVLVVAVGVYMMQEARKPTAPDSRERIAEEFSGLPAKDKEMSPAKGEEEPPQAAPEPATVVSAADEAQPADQAEEKPTLPEQELPVTTKAEKAAESPRPAEAPADDGDSIRTGLNRDRTIDGAGLDEVKQLVEGRRGLRSGGDGAAAAAAVGGQAGSKVVDTSTDDVAAVAEKVHYKQSGKKEPSSGAQKADKKLRAEKEEVGLEKKEAVAKKEAGEVRKKKKIKEKKKKTQARKVKKAGADWGGKGAEGTASNIATGDIPPRVSGESQVKKLPAKDEPKAEDQLTVAKPAEPSPDDGKAQRERAAGYWYEEEKKRESERTVLEAKKEEAPAGADRREQDKDLGAGGVAPNRAQPAEAPLMPVKPAEMPAPALVPAVAADDNYVAEDAEGIGEFSSVSRVDSSVHSDSTLVDPAPVLAKSVQDGEDSAGSTGGGDLDEAAAEGKLAPMAAVAAGPPEEEDAGETEKSKVSFAITETAVAEPADAGVIAEVAPEVAAPVMKEAAKKKTKAEAPSHGAELKAVAEEQKKDRTVECAGLWQKMVELKKRGEHAAALNVLKQFRSGVCAEYRTAGKVDLMEAELLIEMDRPVEAKKRLQRAAEQEDTEQEAIHMMDNLE